MTEAPFIFISIDKLEPPLFRRIDDSRDYMEESIQEHGIITPIIVRPLKNGKFRIIAGHGRYQIAKKLGLKEIPARIVNPKDETEELILSIEENVARKDLTVKELFLAIQELRKRRVKNEQILSRLKISKSTLYRLIWLQDLPEELQDMIFQGKLPLRAVDFIHQIQELKPEIIPRLPQHLSGPIPPEKKAKVLEKIVKDLKREEEEKQTKLIQEEPEEEEDEFELWKKAKEIIKKLVPDAGSFGYALYFSRFMVFAPWRNCIYFFAKPHLPEEQIERAMYAVFMEYTSFIRVHKTLIPSEKQPKLAVFKVTFDEVKLDEINLRDHLERLKEFFDAIYDISGETEESMNFFKFLLELELVPHGETEESEELEETENEIEQIKEQTSSSNVNILVKKIQLFIQQIHLFIRDVQELDIPDDVKEEVVYHLSQAFQLLKGELIESGAGI